MSPLPHKCVPAHRSANLGGVPRCALSAAVQAFLEYFWKAASSPLKALAFSPIRRILTVLIVSPLTILLTTSWPSTTWPKTVCLPSSQAVSLWVMKNWLPLVSGPALAIERVPARSCFSEGSIYIVAKDGVLAIQPGGILMGDEELAAIGVGPRVGHRESAGPIML